MYTFPFGTPITPVRQQDRTPKRVFVLGVYASAVHARWTRDGKTVVAALAVASEPRIFWRGERDEAARIIEGISLSDGAGELEPASDGFNGPSGQALDECFLEPLKLNRMQTWLCDLLPESRCNDSQREALKRYDARRADLMLPPYDFPSVPDELASPERVAEIEAEIATAQPDIIITLGDKPLRHFTKAYGSKATLAAYGESLDVYGRLHEIQIAGRTLELLPLVHPRQAARLGIHSKEWADRHERWAEQVAPTLLTL
jgi:uracil-DNA glycosylase